MDVRVRRQPENELEEDLFDARWLDARDRFARKGTIYADDVSGEKKDNYTFYQRVEIEAREDFDGTFSREFSGIVVETHDQNQNGADVLEADLYSYDYLLRTKQVTDDLSGLSILEALERLIGQSPVYWNANNVEVGDEQTLERSFQDLKIEKAIRELASLSEDEIYGVNDDLEFFFHPPEVSSSGEEITNADWLDYDFPEKDKENVNEVTVSYGPDGELGQVTVDDAPDKLGRESKLNSDGPPVDNISRTFEDITDPQTAEAKAKEILNFFSRVDIGTVTTWKPLLDVSPGETIDIAINPLNIDDEFRIVDIERKWGKQEVDLTVVNNIGDDEELLVELTDRVDRLESQRRDTDAPVDRIIDTDIAAAIEPNITLGGIPADRIRLTNVGRNLIREGWRKQGNLDITQIAVGTDNSGLSRTNESLENETSRSTATESLVGDRSVRYEDAIGDENTREVGLFDSSDNLIVRGIFEKESLSAGDSGVMVQLTVGDNPENQLGVLTENGQIAIRDILADNSPDLPQFYAFGDGDIDPSVSDTDLANRLATQDLDEILIQQALSGSAWSDILTIPDDVPAKIENDSLQGTIITDFSEGQDETSSSGWGNPSSSGYSGGGYGTVQGTHVGDGFVEWQIQFDHSIPVESVGIAIKDEIDDASSEIDPNNNTWEFNGVELDGVSGENKILGWIFLDDGPFYSGPPGSYESKGGTGVESGETYTLRFSWSNAGSQLSDYNVDCIAIYDKRYDADLQFDDTATTVLDGPEWFADPVELQFDTATTRRVVTEATASQTWELAEVSGGQFIELSNDGGDTWIRTNNNDTATATFASPETSVDIRVGIGRYADDGSTTPANGDTSQKILEHRLFANPDAITRAGIGQSETRAVFPAGGDLDSEVLRESAILDQSETALSRSIFSRIPESGGLPSTTTIISSELTRQTQGEFETTTFDMAFDSGFL